jgi:adenosylcobinamide kinase / adenosylcobinamide-phosphate guanylyltransferase
MTLEAETGVGRAIASAPATEWVLLDCMTLLASNVLLSLSEPVDENAYYTRMGEEVDEILAAYSNHSGEWLIVSNEVGLGLVPPYELGRYYRDGLGRANQQLARAADRVLFLVAGIPMVVKGSLK